MSRSMFDLGGLAADCRPPGIQRTGVEIAQSVLPSADVRLEQALHNLMGEMFGGIVRAELPGLVKNKLQCGGFEGKALLRLRTVHAAIRRAGKTPLGWYAQVEEHYAPTLPEIGKAWHDRAIAEGRTDSFHIWFMAHRKLWVALSRLPLPESLPPVKREGGKVCTDKKEVEKGQAALSTFRARLAAGEQRAVDQVKRARVLPGRDADRATRFVEYATGAAKEREESALVLAAVVGKK